MLKIKLSNQFDCDNFITFYCKKTVYIKFSESVHDNECVQLNDAW